MVDAMITALDHVALAVRDLDAQVVAYTALLGVKPNWLGGDGGARHAWFQLENMAFDVITPHGAGAFGDTMRAHLEAHGEGVWALAFTVKDAAAAAARLTRRGLPTGAPHPTRSTHDDGRKRYWTTASIDAQALAGVQALLVDPPRSAEPWPRSPAAGAAPVVALDHVVVLTPDAERAVGNWGGRMGLDLRLDRTTPAFGARQLFFRCGSAVVEVVQRLDADPGDGRDHVGGLAWRVEDAAGARTRMASAGLDVSEVRTGRKPGTRVFTVRSGVVGGPALVIQQGG